MALYSKLTPIKKCMIFLGHDVVSKVPSSKEYDPESLQAIYIVAQSTN